MKYKAIIEIPKDSDRRIHMKYDGSGFEDFGPIKDKISVNDGVMPVAYGYIKGAINKVEKDNVDVLVFSDKTYKTGDTVEVKVIGLLNREDGDHKIIAIDDSVSYKDFLEITQSERELVLDYFGYGHTINIKGTSEALKYLTDCTI